MVTRRTAKVKGSMFEYDVLHNMQRVHDEEDWYLTKERGFQRQYDIESDTYIIECKKHKSISWNQAKKWFKKLEKVNEDIQKKPMLIFQSNRQPVLIMKRNMLGWIIVTQFTHEIDEKFEKHPSTRSKK